MTRRVRRQIDLALQGGGAHGAFTWGVLERLLEDERIEIAGVSGTSAGAMNAVVLTDGLMKSGREGAREALRRFWGAVSNAARPGPLQAGPFAAFFGGWHLERSPLHIYLDLVSRLVSPYQFNPLDINPLREILAGAVDFERVRRCEKVRLFVSATNVRTGNLRVFRNAELTAEVVMASACLPLLFRAVEMDGEAYWDGGYMGNPSLLPLIAESPASDMIVVQINPTRREEVPTAAQDILDRVNEITFNASLIKEMRSVALMKKLIEDEGRPGHEYKEPLFRQVEALRVHRVDGKEELAGLGASSKINTAWSFLSRLHRIGREAADHWLDRNFAHLGRRATINLAREFL
jgi:NTE family protein